MKTAAWILGLALLAALATAGILRSRELSALHAAEGRQQAAQARIAKLRGIVDDVKTFSAWRAELNAKVTLIERLKATAANGALQITGQPAPDAQRLGRIIRDGAAPRPEADAP